MSVRLVVLSEIIAPYRIPVFNALARQDGIDLHVIFLAESDPELREWLVYKDEIGFSYQVLPSWRRRFAGLNLLVNRGLKAALQRLRPTSFSAVATTIRLRGRRCGGREEIGLHLSCGWRAQSRIFAAGPDRRIPEEKIHEELQRFRRSWKVIIPVCDELRSAADEEIFTAPNAVDTELFARSAAMARDDAAVQRHDAQVASALFSFCGKAGSGKRRIRPARSLWQAELLKLRAAVGLVLVGEGTCPRGTGSPSEPDSAGTGSIPGLRSSRSACQLLRPGRRVCFSVALGSVGIGGERGHGLRPAGDFERCRGMHRGPGSGWLEWPGGPSPATSRSWLPPWRSWRGTRSCVLGWEVTAGSVS